MFVWSTVAAISNREEEGIGIDDSFIHTYIHTFIHSPLLHYLSSLYQKNEAQGAIRYYEIYRYLYYHFFTNRCSER